MGKAKAIPYSQDELKELLDYNPESGELIWKERPVSFYSGDLRLTNSWNSRYAGKVAGNSHPFPTGYRNVMLAIRNTEKYLAHRLIWKIMTGENPPDMIDHINRDATDNRWSNLRDGTIEGRNWHNAVKSCRNTSGVTGVYRYKDGVRWYAELMKHGQKYRLGVFDDIRDAENALLEKRRELGGFHPDHGKYSRDENFKLSEGD